MAHSTSLSPCFRPAITLPNHFPITPKGVRRFGLFQTLALCPASKSCISTAEEANDPAHYVPPWDYNAGRKLLGAADRSQAMAELKAAVVGTRPDGWTATVVKQTEQYLYAEYTSPFLGLVDDVEFWIPPGEAGGAASRVEYRSSSRPFCGVVRAADDAGRRRIKALREALQAKGWRSVGF